MKILVHPDKEAAGATAAGLATVFLQKAIEQRGRANLILATGASQFEMLQNLVKSEVDWSCVTCFHLDEYTGMDDSHPASFRRYLRERFYEQLDSPPQFHWVDGAAPDPAAECERLSTIISDYPIDVACVGIGENGHLAFNDPPADFETEAPYLVVDLDEACRRQQLGEGWFPTLEDVPKQAISMSVRHIMRSKSIVCTVPDLRKAEAVRGAAEGAVSPEVPASILQQHEDVTLVLDEPAASLLKS